MKRYNNLYSKICDYDNIYKAHINARQGKANYTEVKMVDSNIHFYVRQIQRMLQNCDYEVSPYKFETIQDKDKIREIAKLPYYPDRIIHWAIMQVIEPILLKTFTTKTYSAIPKRGIHKAFRDCKKSIKSDKQFFLKIDVCKFYENINHIILKKKLLKLFKDYKLIFILNTIIDSYDKGLPIGNYTSQYLANFYLNDVDHYVKEQLKLDYYRYMDDIVILCKDKEQCIETYKIINQLINNLKLKLHTPIIQQVKYGISFVGYIFTKNKIKVRPKIDKHFNKVRKRIRHKNNKSIPITLHNKSSYFSLWGWYKKGEIYGTYKNVNVKK